MPNKDDYTTQITRMSTNNFNTSQISDEVWEGKSFVFGAMASNPYRINALYSGYMSSAGCYTCVLIPNTVKVYIDGSDDNWVVTFTPLDEDMFTFVTISGNSQYCFPSRIYQNKIIFNGFGGYGSVPFDSYMSTGIYPSSFTTFDDAIDFVSFRFSNVDLIVNGEYWIGESPVVPITSNGGGATHIAKVTGQLSSLSNNLSDILMVSGGGGGGLIIGEDVYVGKDAGGISGNGNNSANQTTGYAFGQGESANGVSGGGGGLYGGYKGGTS